MRQAGVLAAPGIIALKKMITRLEEDHKNARILGQGLDQIGHLVVDLDSIQTNIVIFDVGNLGVSSKDFVYRLRERKILALDVDDTRVRMVTHRGISKSNIESALSAVEEIIGDL